MTQEEQKEKGALDSYDGHRFNPEPWEIPAIIALVILATFWLVRTRSRNQKLREKGAELCRKSLEK